MTVQPQPEPTLRDLADKLDRLTTDLDQLTIDVDRRFDTLSQSFEKSNDKFDNYQQATQWVVQLAFTLIASATITVILTTVFK
jgi:predicted PurR-regulated permease PerM